MLSRIVIIRVGREQTAAAAAAAQGFRRARNQILTLEAAERTERAGPRRTKTRPGGPGARPSGRGARAPRPVTDGLDTVVPAAAMAAAERGAGRRPAPGSRAALARLKGQVCYVCMDIYMYTDV